MPVICVVNAKPIWIVLPILVFFWVWGEVLPPGVGLAKKKGQVLDQTISMGRLKSSEESSCPGKSKQ
jgi:hypothetical protein